MPANLTPAYYKAQERYRAASSPEDQLAALREMLRAIPKHKGTEHLQADLKKRIKEATVALRTRRKQSKGPSFAVHKGGHPQVVVLGPPNAGKSALVAALTGIEHEVAPYPYTTHEPHPAILPFENARLQMVDMPPIFVDHMEPWIPGVARGADAIVLVVDLQAADVLEGFEGVVEHLARNKFFLGEVPAAQPDAANATVKPALLAANKWDLDGAAETLEVFQELAGTDLEIVPVSATTGDGLKTLRKRIWRMLDLVRAIPKPPHAPPDYEDPILLHRGETVMDMARVIHREMAEHLKRVRVWNCSDHADGQCIGRDHVVEDMEVFELET